MEQFERAQRYLKRVQAIYGGILSSKSHDKDAYEDDVISFFMHCYHIRDWVVHLNKISVTASQVDAFINKHESLRICADLCNGSKHCKITRNIRTGKQPHIAGKTYRSSTWITGSGGGEVLQGKYSILTSSGAIDALELAESCIGLWSGFIAKMNEAYIEALQPQKNKQGIDYAQ